ncbi:hypothetical protein X797_010315 [Metarhizium robertsii]|uniref:Uncharacterized protein n=1 Tax=Metarhizium robertsii TaxID=568076 RepID=A0A014MYA8_9HYPO|nr:hypothetical protein X797_010315 [Metarhizium robertsii]
MVITPGCRSNTFGIPSVEENGIFVKNVANANTMRSRLNDLLEMASLPPELTDLFDGDLGLLFPHLKGKASVALLFEMSNREIDVCAAAGTAENVTVGEYLLRMPFLALPTIYHMVFKSMGK